MRYIFFLLTTLMTIYADGHIFLYHRFNDDRFPSTNTTTKELIREFNYLKQNGYKVIPLKDMIDLYKQNKTIDDKLVSLVVDDNFKSFYEYGLEIFKKFNYPFTLFVYVKATEKKYSDYCTWDELKEISKYGDLQYHCYSHLHMTRTSDEKLKEDFKKGLSIFEKRLGFKPKYFSYPYGEYDERVRKIAKSFGFEAIFNQNIGAFSKDSNLLDIPRNALVGKADIEGLLKYKVLKTEWIYPKKYPKNGIIPYIKVKLYEAAKQGGIYITQNGWQPSKIDNNILYKNVEANITKDRVRIIVSVKNKIDTKLLVKDSI